MTRIRGRSKITWITARGAEIYAIVETSGKQYRVAPGDTIEVDRLPQEAGDSIELGRVLLLAEGEQVWVGAPTVPGAKVIAEVVGHDKGKKITVYKYKAKTRYRRKKGHRQLLSRLKIKEIKAG